MTLELELMTVLIIFAAPLPYAVAVAVAIARYLNKQGVWQTRVRADIKAIQEKLELHGQHDGKLDGRVTQVAEEVRHLRERFIAFEARGGGNQDTP